MNCEACGSEVLDIDVKCGACGARLTSTGAQRMIGHVALGQYEIIDILGQGGMAIVYKGVHRLTGQEVALKILPPELAAHSQVKSRFVEEAKALAALDHPNIVHLYNFGEENGAFVLAMQLVRGETWERQILEEQEVDWPRHTWITIDVLRALEYAHERGVIHRDMKPSNVLVREHDGTATVMDFGIAKMTTSSKLTATGQTMGTVRYMSPEQVRGLSVDARTDLYSLGATLYEAVVGDTPFDGDTHFEIMTKHLSEPPRPPGLLGIEVPRDFEDILMRTLAKKPEDRFPSARELRKALERVLADHDIGRADTQRMTREGLALKPKVKAKAEASGPAEITGLARTLEPSGPHQASAGETTDVSPAAKGKPAVWIALAVTVLVASAAVALVMMRNRGTSQTSTKPDPTPRPQPKEHPEPFATPDVKMVVDQQYAGDKLRVQSVARLDPKRVRRAWSKGHERFAAFLAQRKPGLSLKRYSMNIQVVTQQTMCDPRIYRDPRRPAAKAPANCAENSIHFRPLERTLLVVDNAQFEASMSYGVAFAACTLGGQPDVCAAVNPFDQAVQKELGGE